MISLSKKCPKCGDEIPDEARFCKNCGHKFNDEGASNYSTLSNGKIFLVVIAIIVIIGAILLSGAFNHSNETSDAASGSDSLEFKISSVYGSSYYYEEENETDYTIVTSALFTKIPSDLNGYIVKTTYFDKNNDRIGQSTETLSNVIYDPKDIDYEIAFGYYNSYKKFDPDHVTVEITKEKSVVANDTYQIDKNKIEFL